MIRSGDFDTAGAVPDAVMRSSAWKSRSGEEFETERPATECDEISPP